LCFSKKRYDSTKEALMKFTNKDLTGLDQKLMKGIFSSKNTDLGNPQLFCKEGLKIESVVSP